MNSVRAAFRSVLGFRARELRVSLLMFLYFWLVTSSFWILKPLKKGQFVAYYEARSLDVFGWSLGVAQAELVCKVGNVVVAVLATLCFAGLARRLRRAQLVLVFVCFFVLCLSVFAHALKQPGPIAVWSFYLFGDLFSTLMVAAFFVFLHDLMSPGSAKRTYGFIGLGGVLGGIFGSVVLRVWIDALDLPAWLAVCSATTALIGVVALWVGRVARSSAYTGPVAGSAPLPGRGQTQDSGSLLEGGWMVLRSKHLRAIVGIVALYEMVSSIMDFQFTATLAHYLEGEDEIQRQLATVYTLTNGISAFVQLFLTGYVMRRFGVAVALSVLCLSTLAGSGAFAIMPALWVGSLLNTADNAFSYSIHQSAKESLYVPTSRDEKYQAKAFIDILGQRLAKVVAVLLSLALTLHVTEFSSVRWLSLLTVGLSVALLFVARYAGRSFDELSSGRESVV